MSGPVAFSASWLGFRARLPPPFGLSAVMFQVFTTVVTTLISLGCFYTSAKTLHPPARRVRALAPYGRFGWW